MTLETIVGVTSGYNGERCIIATFTTGDVAVSWEYLDAAKPDERMYAAANIPKEVADLRAFAMAHDSRVTSTITGRLCVLGPSMKTHRRDLIVREYASVAEFEEVCAQWFHRIMHHIS